MTFPLSTIARANPGRKAEEKEAEAYVFASWGQAGRVEEARGILSERSAVVGREITAHDLRRHLSAIAGECRIEFWRCELPHESPAKRCNRASSIETSDLVPIR